MSIFLSLLRFYVCSLCLEVFWIHLLGVCFGLVVCFCLRVCFCLGICICQCLFLSVSVSVCLFLSVCFCLSVSVCLEVCIYIFDSGAMDGYASCLAISAQWLGFIVNQWQYHFQEYAETLDGLVCKSASVVQWLVIYIGGPVFQACAKILCVSLRALLSSGLCRDYTCLARLAWHSFYRS